MEQVIIAKQKQITSTNLSNNNDLLDRKILAKNFVSVLMSQKANVFSINGGWGSGKTWFLKFIEDECLSQEEIIPFIKYNVWENDYLNNPLQSITSELISKIDSLADSIVQEPCLQELKDEIKDIKQISFKFFQLLKKVKITPQITHTLSDGSSTSYGLGLEYNDSNTDEINAYDNMKKIKNDFTLKLKSIIQLLGNREIIIAIDELDRCRPDYAIRTLEVIKHFFNIDGIKFILAVDKEQLANTVKALYGQNADTDCYLRKFVDIEYYLPSPKEYDIGNYVREFIENKYPNIKTVCENKNSSKGVLYFNTDSGYMYPQRLEHNEYINSIISAITDSYYKADLRLRDLEKLLFKLNIIINQFNNIESFHFPFLWNLLLMNTKYNDFYKMIKHYNIQLIEIKDYMNSKTDNKYYQFILKNRELNLIIQAIKKGDYSHSKTSTPINDFAFKYVPDLRRYFEIIDMAIGFALK